MKHRLCSNIVRYLRLPVRDAVGAMKENKIVPDEEGLKEIYKKFTRVGFEGNVMLAATVVKWHGGRYGWAGGGLMDKMLLECLQSMPEICVAVYRRLQTKGPAELSLVFESCTELKSSLALLAEAEAAGIPLTEACYASLIKSCGDDVKAGFIVFRNMVSTTTPTAITYAALMRVCLAARDFKSIGSLYTELRSRSPDLPAEIYHILLLAGQQPSGLPLPIADEVFKQAISKGHTHPDIYYAYLACLEHHGDARAKELWATIVKKKKNRGRTEKIELPLWNGRSVR